jgi:hypothetical protein
MGLRDWLRSWSKAERHRRKVERELWSPLPPIRPAETAEFDRLDEGIRMWKTGEFPVVLHDEPIGPSLPTVDDRYALFAADPLSAPLPGAPVKDNVLYAGLLDEHPISAEVRADLESVTGYWTTESMRQLLERGKR